MAALTGGAVNAALNGGNPFLAGLIGGFSAGVLGGLMPPGFESPALGSAAAASHLGVFASGFAPGMSGGGSHFTPGLQLAQADTATRGIMSDATPGCDVCPNTNLDTISLLARLIFAAAARQYRIPNAMEGVGHVVRNRVLSPRFPNTYEDVIFQRRQFDEVNSPLWRLAENPRALTGPNAVAYSRALTVAEGVYNGTIPDPTGGAIGFHSLDQYTHPGNSRWQFSTQIGPFKFFKLP